MAKEPNYCGCCGRECLVDWCEQCKKHVNPRKTFWDATYLAQYGVDCPFQDDKTRFISGVER